MANSRSGVNNPRAKLDDNKVREIRKHHVRNGGGKTSAHFAEDYDVTQGTVDAAFRGRTWKHVV